MTQKECFKCKHLKPLSEFYKHKMMADGHVNKCKECNKHDVRANRQDKISYYKAYDRLRANTPKRVEGRAAYSITDDAKQALQKTRKKWIENNAIKYAASLIVNNAVRSGKIKKLYTCEICGIGGRIHGHHDDYAKPLDVRWLCPQCHSDWHKINGEGASSP
jgi:Zn finger protein HypA/HybF involved in hydrogenase expression